MVIRLRGSCDITRVNRNETRLELTRLYGAKVFPSLDGLKKDAYDVVVEVPGSRFLMDKNIGLVRKGEPCCFSVFPGGVKRCNSPPSLFLKSALLCFLFAPRYGIPYRR
jgi:hypothetical protein